MVQIDDVKKAMRMVENYQEWLNCSALHKQLASSLELYQDRGEFDGSLQSAIECLEQACYEVQSEN